MVAGVLPGLLAVAPQVARAADVSVVLDGHGNGHGVGLSQWGAYGYAVDKGFSAQEILDHYYGGTVSGTVPIDSQVRVRLQNLDGAQTAVSVETGELVVDGLTGGPAGGPTAGPWRSVLVRETAPAVYSVWARADLVRCPASSGDPAATGWTLLNAAVPTSVSVHTLADSTTISDPKQLQAVCEPGGTLRWYRGVVRALNDSSGGNHTIGVLPLEQYLRTVIAMEMSPGWAADGGGRGAQALQAQAVAARSYALSYQWYSYADVCDMSCQAYFGVAYQTPGGSVRLVDAAATDAAVLATAGVVRRVGTTAGPIAITMFSASNGGYSATNNNALTPFPALPDEGDGTAKNPYHNWTVTISGATIALRYPAIGAFTGLTVLTRNGFGEWGGRVLTLSVVGTAGSVTVTGAAFRTALGLRDTWFNVRGSSPAPDPCSGRDTPTIVGAQPAAGAARFTPIDPVRLIDTRSGKGTAELPLAGGCTLVVDPALDASVTAVTVNLTSVNPSASGFVTAYPCGVARPNVSAIQVIAGRNVAGSTVVTLGADGTFCVYSSTTINLVVDLFGSYAPAVGSRYQPINATRAYDSRSRSTPLPAGTIVHVPVVGAGKAPAGSVAAALTVHSTGATGVGFATVYPCSASVPTVSSLNTAPGVQITNHVQVQLSASGEVCVYISAPMYITVDLSGWFGAAATTDFYAIAPYRAVDTRSNVGLTGISVSGSNRPITLAGANGLPSAATLKAVVAEVTAVSPQAPGFLIVHACLATVPSVSMVRYLIAANAATTVVSPDDGSGRWCISTSATTQVLVDVSGYFA